MASTRQRRGGGTSNRRPRRPQSQTQPRARERIAAARAGQRRREARRRILLAIGSAAGVVAIAVGLVVVKLTAGPPAPPAPESLAPAAVVRQVTRVPDAVLTRIPASHAITPLEPARTPGKTLTIGGKPAIVFVSEESCPFCAAERWPLTIALSHFGAWSHLGTTRSSTTDIYPGIATLSFRAAAYRSQNLVLRTTELTDNLGRPLQHQTPLDIRLLGRYDVPPYVNSAAQSGAVPFLDIGNRYILAGAQYNPQVLAGLSATQIAGRLRNPASPVAQAIDGSANVIIAAIRHLLDQHAG